MPEAVSIRSLIALVLAAATVMALAPGVRAETLECLVSRGNLCFSTGCDNSGKSQRMTLDLSAGSYRLCPNRFNDEGCFAAPMQFDIRDSAIVGVSNSGPEISARAIFVNRVTGALSTALLAAGMSGVDFGSCEVPR